MTITQEILEELRKGVPLAEVDRKFRSKSQKYEAIRLYLPEADKIVNDKREILRKVEEGLSKTDAEFQRVNREKKVVSAEVVKLQSARERLTAEVCSATKTRDCLHADVKKLEARGYSPAVMKKLVTIEARSGPDLLAQVETAERVNQLKAKESGLQKRIATLGGEGRDLETKKRGIEESMVSEKNRLDQMRVETVSYKEAVDVTESLLKEGYGVEEIKSLRHGLRVFGIKGDPHVSVTRLVRGLTSQKTLITVEEKLRGERKERAQLKRALTEVKNELAVTTQATLDSIQKGQKASMQAIASARDFSTQTIAENTKQAEEGLNRTVERFEARAKESLGKLDTQIQQAGDRYEAELKETTKLEHRKAEVESVLGPGLPLVGLLQSPEDLKKVPLAFMVQLLEKVQAWCETNMPGASVRPTKEIEAKDSYLMTLRSYKLAVLVELARECLKECMARQNKKL